MREQLEEQARQSVCPCWYYDLCDQMDETEDDTLREIIADPQYGHKHAQQSDPVSSEEYEQELANCTTITK
jgi:hypothetical protein